MSIDFVSKPTAREILNRIRRKSRDESERDVGLSSCSCLLHSGNPSLNYINY